MVLANSTIVVSGPVIRTANYTAYPVIEHVTVNSPMNITVNYYVNSTVTVKDMLDLPAPGIKVTLTCGTKSISTYTNMLGTAQLLLNNVPTVMCNVEYARPVIGYYGIIIIVVIVIIALAFIILRLRYHSI